ncbi:uncharacterized protein [Dysidea avara]|uniref:uncharacterized protein isoform X2 n=1 Tax=Dysidea avara TaxID=196820 RepID=UPI00332C187C
MDLYCLPFIKSSKRVKRSGEAEAEWFDSGNYAPDRQRSTRASRYVTHSMQDLPPPAALLTKSHDVSMDSQLTEEYYSTQEVPSSPELKRSRNLSPFFTQPQTLHDNFYEVSIEHEWEEAPVDVAVPKVTVRRRKKSQSTNTNNQDFFHGESQFLQLPLRFTDNHKVSATNHQQSIDDPCSSNIMLNILPHEE